MIDRTAASMQQSIYQNALATQALNGVNVKYNTVENTQYARGMSKPIVCGRSSCGSLESPTGEYCKYQ